MVTLTYHSVKANQTDQFKKHMDALLKAGNGVSADSAYTPERGGCKIAVTFDDGFQSVVENALPILRELKIPATIFVTTGYLGKKPGWIRDGHQGNANEIIITEDQLRKVSDKLITVGSHSVTHPKFMDIGKDKVLDELIESRMILENILSRPVYLFSFPYGSYDREIIKLSKQAGYEKVFSNVPISRSSGYKQYLLGRLNVSLDDSMIEYWLKIRGGYQWLSLAVVLKREVKGLIKKTWREIRVGT